MTEERYVIGVDFGTDSVRALIVNADTGATAASAVHEYARWRQGRYGDAVRQQFRQHPRDYLESLEHCITAALAQAPRRLAENVKGISVDTTGSTPVAVDRAGAPLALRPEFADNPHAMFVLWKDHTAVAEAEAINQHARAWGEVDYTRYCGGVYSSEWFWAKLLHTLHADEDVRRAAFSWVEHCDWIPAALTGVNDALQIKRSRCAAGHKAMWHEAFGGLPSEEFLTSLDPLLAGWRARLYDETHTVDVCAGPLSEEWAQRLGLDTNVAVGIGAFDAHMGAVGAGITPHTLCKVIGTSTCDVLIAPTAEIGDKLVRGICGQVDGSVIPGMLGMEAGQSAFGDVYAWFRQLLLWPLELLDESLRAQVSAALTERLIPELAQQAARLPIEESSIVALDWLNGRRTPNADQMLTGALTGLHLGSDAPRVFKALVEATAFGARKIVDCFTAQGVRVDGVLALGGVAHKAPFVMQTLTDVLNRPLRIARAEQACARGAAMCAAVAAGLHPDVIAAQRALGQGVATEHQPAAERAAHYDRLYEKYERLGAFVEQETHQGL